MNPRMKLLFKAIFIFVLLISCSVSKGQGADPAHLRFSLITCGPGDELYSTWGHTAIRATDSATGMDIVFNYGTFDNSDPYFYIKFTRGIMRYALSVEQYTDFLQEYREDHRSVVAQALSLNNEQKKRLFDLLKANASEENRYYDYSFYEDNCTTRAKAIINKCTGDSIVFKNILTGKAPTFRELFHINLDSYHQLWSEFGIDLLLGSNLDKQATSEQAMFLPDYLMKGFDSASVQKRVLVDKKTVILQGSPPPKSALSITPVSVLLFLAVIFISMSFSNNRSAQKALEIMDAVLFILLGLLGILIVSLWACRVDAVCRNNWNVLWAWPTHAVVAFLSGKRRPWVRTYFRIAALVAFLILLGWRMLPQQFNIAFAPLLIIIVLRGYAQPPRTAHPSILSDAPNHSHKPRLL